MIATTTALLMTASVFCTNLNWEHSTRCNAPVVNMVVHEWGYDGYLETGVYWKQVKINDDLQYFSMEKVQWFITSNGIVPIE